MKFICLCTMSALLLFSGAAFAQSSGNFSASYTPATCKIGAGGTLSGGTEIKLWESDISTSSGNGVTLLIRPSMVTGLFTRTKIDTTVSTASADVGIQVCVKVDESGDGVLPKSCVTYDQRFQQVSSNLFSQITECQSLGCTTNTDCAAAGAGAVCNLGICVLPTTTACDALTPCATGQVCVIPAGATAGTCASTALNPLCDFELILSTLSAHSFDFVIPVSNKKPHKVTAEWSVIGLPANNTGNSSVASCVGPGILTVTQTKVFNNSGSLINVEPQP